MNFTNEELVEIEKMADHWAGMNLRGFADIIQKLALAWRMDREKHKNVEELTNKIFKDMSHSYDMFRTISTKAAEMRK